MIYVLNSQGSMTFPRRDGFTNVPLRDTGSAENIMRQLAGQAILVLEGGADINPKLYGEEITYTHWVSHARDEHEVFLFRLARELGIPMIGNCRGHQLMAALDGGKLYQDLEAELGRGHYGGHTVTFTDAAREKGFVDLMQSNPTGSPDRVNSLHHQAVRPDALPEHGVPLAYHLDGSVEAIWYPWGVGVQWHPEFLGHTEFLSYIVNQFMKVQNAVQQRHNDGARDRGTAPEQGGSAGSRYMAEVHAT